MTNLGSYAHVMTRGPYYAPLTADRVARIQDLLRLDCIDVTGPDHVKNRLLPLWDYAQQMYNEDTGCDPIFLCASVANMIRVCEGVGYDSSGSMPKANEHNFLVTAEVTERMTLIVHATDHSHAESIAQAQLEDDNDANVMLREPEVKIRRVVDL